MSTNDLDPKDYKYIKKNPKYNFAKARALVEETMKETDEFFKKNSVLLDDDIKDRIDAVATYGCYRLSGRGTKSPEDYFGRKFWTRYVGEKILSKVRVMKTVNKLQNNDKYKDFIVL